MAIFTRSTLLPLCLGLVVTSVAAGQNVDLSTIPPRDTVQLTIYNSEDITLVRETRRITFARGANPIQFSWANTLIDPSSVDLRFKTHADKLDIADTTFPHDKPQMLYWNIISEHDGDAVVEISYFTSGITWAADYVCTSDVDEQEMAFEGFVQITNNSGEDYADAQVRLVVGTINLVERVADLAARGMISRSNAEGYYADRDLNRLDDGARGRVLRSVGGDMERAAGLSSKEIVKEGLSEYFIYTIEGTETVRHTWSKRMRLFQGHRVPFSIKYRYRPAEYGEQLVRLYILRNDEASRLGSTPLPDGVIRLFRHNGRDGLSFLTAYTTKYVPIGQEIELNLGVDPEVIHERIRLASWRDGFWFSDRKGKTYLNMDNERQVRHDYPVAGWDDHERWVERVRNYRGKPVDVEFRRTFNGHCVFTSGLEPALHDYRTPQFSAIIAAGVEADLGYDLTFHQGINHKQENVTLEANGS